MRIEDKIRRAFEIYEKFRDEITGDEEVRDLLKRLEESINETRRYMEEIGVVDICRECAAETGSCCGMFVEDYYDEIILLINLLLGINLPEKRRIKGYCFFLSDKGCTLKAREVICVNYLCKRITDRIGDKEIELQEIAERELKTCFLLRERIKRIILDLQQKR